MSTWKAATATTRERSHQPVERPVSLLHEVRDQRPPRRPFEVPPAIRDAGRNAVRRFRRVVVGLVAYDAVVLVAAVVLAGAGATLGAVHALVVLVGIGVTGGYRQRISPTMGEELPVLVARVAVSAGLVGVAVPGATTDLSRGALAATVLLAAGRFVAYGLLRRARRRGRLQEPTLIIGAGRKGVLVARTLTEHPEYGLVPVGFVDRFDDDLDPPIVGDVDRLDEILDEGWVRRIIVAFGANREADLVGILRAADRHSVEVHVLPRFFELGVVPASGDTDVIWGIPLIRVRRAALRSTEWRTKRAVDLALALGLLVLAAPMMGLVALAVKLDSPGPILFRQRRVGQRGREVEILKFRSMPVNDDSDRTWTVDADQRIRPLGRLLRRTSLDELPQLFNVIRGDMSIVGPRPERPAFASAFDAQVPRYGDRHRVPAGLTGWAQIHRLRGDTSIEERARFDNFYIEHWSLWRDLLIMVRTLPAMLQRSTADEATAADGAAGDGVAVRAAPSGRGGDHR